MKSRVGKSQRREEKKKEDQRRKSQKKEDPGARKKVGKSRNETLCSVFPMICGSRGSKSGLGKAAGAEPSGLHLGREMKNCTPSWREAHFEAKMYKTPQCRTTPGSCDVEKVRTVVARSTF